MEFEKLKLESDIRPQFPEAEYQCINDLGADFFVQFQSIMGLEEEFDIEIPNEEAEKIVTVGDAVEQIKNALNS